jgi:hypothetical protein
VGENIGKYKIYSIGQIANNPTIFPVTHFNQANELLRFNGKIYELKTLLEDRKAKKIEFLDSNNNPITSSSVSTNQIKAIRGIPTTGTGVYSKGHLIPM